MRVLLYFQDENFLKTSGIGRARKHQALALESVGVDYTFDPLADYDIAHINTIYGKSQRLLKKCRKKGIPVIVHGHSTHEDWRESFLFWKAMEPFFDRNLDWIYSRADLIITPTPYSKKLIESYGFNVPVKAISNGIMMDQYGPNPKAEKEFRKLFHLGEEEKYVMGVGFPFVRKGLPDFFTVARSFPNTKFFWFGHLPPIAETPEIHKAIHHKPSNCIMPGYIAGNLIKGAYQGASAMFFPSYEETEGIVVLEALASKTPLVVRDIGVYDPWLHDGVDCHKCKNNEEFVSALRALLTNGEDPKILEAGYKIAEARDVHLIGKELKEAYEELLSKKK